MTQSTPEQRAEDAELERLLQVCCNHAYAFGGASNSLLRRTAFEREDAARTALLAYIAAHYVRRDDPRHRILDRASEALVGYTAARGILPWRPGDELPEERIRRLRDDADDC